MSHADDLQAVSVDEALIDVTETVSQLRHRAAIEGSPYDPAKDFAETIRAEVRKATSCESTSCASAFLFFVWVGPGAFLYRTQWSVGGAEPL